MLRKRFPDKIWARSRACDANIRSLMDQGYTQDEASQIQSLMYLGYSRQGAMKRIQALKQQGQQMQQNIPDTAVISPSADSTPGGPNVVRHTSEHPWRNAAIFAGGMYSAGKHQDKIDRILNNIGSQFAAGIQVYLRNIQQKQALRDLCSLLANPHFASTIPMLPGEGKQATDVPPAEIAAAAPVLVDLNTGQKPEEKGDPIAQQWLELTRDPGTILIIGDQGSGKSALAYYLLSLYRFSNAFVLNLPENAQAPLPPEIGVVMNLGDVPNNSTVLIDEAYLSFFSRESQTKRARELLGILALARQKRLRLIFVSQESRYVDVNILSRISVLAVKNPGLFQAATDRPEVSAIVQKAKEAFDGIQRNRQKYTYVYSEKFEGMLENPCPDFFDQRLSCAFADMPVILSEERIPKEFSRQEKKKEAKRLYKLGWSMSKIAEVLGVAKGTVWNYLHEDRDLNA